MTATTATPIHSHILWLLFGFFFLDMLSSPLFLTIFRAAFFWAIFFTCLIGSLCTIFFAAGCSFFIIILGTIFLMIGFAAILCSFFSCACISFLIIFMCSSFFTGLSVILCSSFAGVGLSFFGSAFFSFFCCTFFSTTDSFAASGSSLSVSISSSILSLTGLSSVGDSSLVTNSLIRSIVSSSVWIVESSSLIAALPAISSTINTPSNKMYVRKN